MGRNRQVIRAALSRNSNLAWSMVVPKRIEKGVPGWCSLATDTCAWTAQGKLTGHLGRYKWCAQSERDLFEKSLFVPACNEGRFDWERRLYPLGKGEYVTRRGSCMSALLTAKNQKRLVSVRSVRDREEIKREAKVFYGDGKTNPTAAALCAFDSPAYKLKAENFFQVEVITIADVKVPDSG